MELTIQQNKQLIQVYPFLQPRNVWTGDVLEDYDYTYINGVGDLPKGWERLFLLYCKHLRQELLNYDFLDKFRFSQIKEKYGSMRLYNFGYPKDSRVTELEYIFEHLSTYVCEDCGKVAVYETPGWITELCAKCYRESYQFAYSEDPTRNRMKRKRYFVKLEGFSKDDGFYSLKYDCRPYWEEYKRCMKLTDQEFFNYIIS